MSTFFENWNARHLERYARDHAAGLHDQDCEQRERSSLCHCSKRRRETAGRTDLPFIVWHHPTCTGCGERVDHDGDRFTCATCRTTWSSDASDGDQADHFNDDHGPMDGTHPWGGPRFGARLIDVLAGDA